MTAEYMTKRREEEQPLAPDQKAENWSGIASDYERAFETLTRQFAEALVERLSLTPEHRVLDVATGTGAFALAAARSGAEVLATDFAPGMIARLRQRLDEAAIHHVQAAVMDGQNLALEDAGFDIVASVVGVIFFPDILRGLREMKRVLKPGGRCAIVCWDAPEHFDMMVALRQAIERAVPGFELPSQPPVWARMCGEDSLRQHLQQAGFSRIETWTQQGELVIDKPARFWADFTSAAPPLASLFARLGAANVERVGQAFVEIITQGGRQPAPALQARACLGVGHVE